MKVIEVTHPIQPEQLINEDVAMAFGFFDGMHKGHLKVFLKHSTNVLKRIT